MLNVRQAGGHLYGKQLITLLSLVVSFMVSFVLSFFPLDVLDWIWNLIESVSEGFLTYSFIFILFNFPFISLFLFLILFLFIYFIFSSLMTLKCFSHLLIY